MNISSILKNVHVTDPENWMREMKGIERCPLYQLTIPGSHDCGTYGISDSCDYAPDAKAFLTKLDAVPGAKQFAKRLAADWAKTQTHDLKAQFDMGVRYLDLRVCVSGPTDFRICHTLQGPSLLSLLHDILTWSLSHPQEIIFLGFRKFWGFTPEDHQRFVLLLHAKLGSLLMPRNSPKITVEKVWAAKKSIILFYHKEEISRPEPMFWEDRQCSTQWYDKQETAALLEAIEGQMQKPLSTCKRFFLIQAMKTPNTREILQGLNFLGSSAGHLLKWVEDTTAALTKAIRTDWLTKPLNAIVMTDHIDLEFTNACISRTRQTVEAMA